MKGSNRVCWQIVSEEEDPACEGFLGSRHLVTIVDNIRNLAKCHDEKWQH